MKKWLSIFVSFLLFHCANAQLNIKAILPDKPIVVNDPFPIQFKVENADGKQEFVAPVFNGLKVIRGPEKYEGSQVINNKETRLINYIYTLVADKQGVYRIDPPVIRSNGIVYSGAPITILVERKNKSTQHDDDYSGQRLLPGEDPYQKIKENLFVKLVVNKETCLVGEPVVATFKLFSRLQSRSDIVKNPGFYGFSVYDMINLDDKIKETERINGKDFDVHTIRKVQLYPLQPGEYTIDEMKIDNKVAFFRSSVTKKTEQKISEGVLNENDESFDPGSEVYETSIVTKPVKIKVHSLPQKNIPADFNGAAGQFTIHASLEKTGLDKNEEGFLLITIEGKGNFTQLTAPVIQWPKELEGFESSVKDFLDKRLVPLSGARIFRYPFISSLPGQWKIPKTRFSFFNTNTKNYQTLSTDSLFVTISSKEYKKPATEVINSKKKTSIEEVNKKVSRIAFTLVALFIVLAVIYWSFKGKRKKSMTDEQQISPVQTIDDLFLSISDLTTPAKEFYKELHQTTWKFLIEHYHLSGTAMNKHMLAEKLNEKGNDQASITELFYLLDHFETAMFTNIGVDENREELIDQTKAVLRQLIT